MQAERQDGLLALPLTLPGAVVRPALPRTGFLQGGLVESLRKPYMWTNTNKYMSKVITDWRNVEDSKYKEFTDE